MTLRLSKKILNSAIYQAAKAVCLKFHKHNFEAYIVGGSVRDFILFPTFVPKDIDITTSANVTDIESLFPNCVLVGKNFGVCVVKVQEFAFEVATFRKDGAYLDRRHPSSISVGTLFEDTQRRDFTINALYYSPAGTKILDFHGGLKDIKNKTIRCVGSADDRIYEDALRILRCLRFSANFEFKIEKSLITAIKKHFDGLKLIPMERVFDELSKVCRALNFVHRFYLYLDISLFFKGMSKKTAKQIQIFSLKEKNLSNFKFSSQSMFFDFFILFLRYFKINDFNVIKTDISALPCTVYDKKLCLWFIGLLNISMPLNEFEFFSALIHIERMEKDPHQKIFTFLKKILANKMASKIITNYVKNKKNFSQAAIIQNLKQNNVPEKQYSSIITKKYFDFVMKPQNSNRVRN